MKLIDELTVEVDEEWEDEPGAESPAPAASAAAASEEAQGPEPAIEPQEGDLDAAEEPAAPVADEESPAVETARDAAEDPEASR